MLRAAARRPGRGRAPRIRNLAAAAVALCLTLGALACEAPLPDSEARDAPEAERARDVPRAEAAFHVALWPGEGRPVLAASGTSLVLRAAPADTSGVVSRVTVSPGEEIPFTETVYRTVRPGAVMLSREHVLVGRAFGDVDAIDRDAYYAGDVPRREWTLSVGDTLALLQHRAEGSCFVRVRGSVVEADPCPVGSSDAARLLSAPVVEWWVRVDAPAGRSGGWVRVGDGVTEAGRRF